jgi:pentatricopeptide repeat protein
MKKNHKWRSYSCLLQFVLLTACSPESLQGFVLQLSPAAVSRQGHGRGPRNRSFVLTVAPDTNTDTDASTVTPAWSSSQSSEPAQRYNNSDSNSDVSNSNSGNNETEYQFWEDRLSTRNFNMDLHNLAVQDPEQAQDALEIMQTTHDSQPDNPGTCRPDATCYNTVIDGWIQAGRPDRAQQVLDQMEVIADAHAVKNASVNGTDYNDTTTLALFAPSDLSYIMVAQGWADDVKDDTTGKSAEHAVKVMRRMQHRGLAPSVKMWSIVMEGWCKRAGKVRGVMRRAESLLQEMEDAADAVQVQQRDVVPAAADSKNDNDPTATNATTTTTKTRNTAADAHPKPNVLTYTSYIGGLARSRESDLARKAEAVLERMDRFGVEPDMVAYTSVLNCWASAVSRRERELAASRACHILDLMERMYSKEKYQVKPSLITYATAIKAIGNSLDRNAPKMAEDVIEHMYQLHETGKIANLKPTTAIYNALINALGQSTGKNGLRQARRAEQILGEMTKRAEAGEKDVQPDVRTWATVLRAWARSGLPDAAENIQRIIDKLDSLYQKGESTFPPNYVCYTTSIGAWGRSRRKDALERVEDILTRMEKEYEETQESSVRPNHITYVTAMDAFVRRNERDAAQRAQAIVDRMMRLYGKGIGHVRPTTVVFNVLINAWSRSSEKDAAKKAEQIFKWMEVRHRLGDSFVKPDEVSLCAVLNAWANNPRNGGAERAQQILEHVESKTPKERGFEYSIICHNIVIKAIARSADPQAVEKAEQILLRLEEDHRSGKSNLHPDVTTYSSLINACAYYTGNAEGRANAFEVAMRTFRKLCDLKDEPPNNITFGTLLKAIAHLQPVSEERDELVLSLFDQCCTEGLVDSFVLSQVRIASPQLFRDLVDEPCGLGGPDDDDSIHSVLKNIPSEWSANVVTYS